MDSVNDIHVQSIRINLNAFEYRGSDIDAIYSELHEYFDILEITYRWEPAAVAPDLMEIVIEVSDTFNTLAESITYLAVISKFIISLFGKIKKALAQRHQISMSSRESGVHVILKDFSMEIHFDALNELKADHETYKTIQEAIKSKKQ